MNETKAFRTLSRALTTRAYHARRPLLIAAAVLFAGLGNDRDARLAERLTRLSEIPNYADFQAAALAA